MNKSARFRQSIDFIEKHLYEDIPLEQAAQAGYTSLMQLYREFYTYTGHSVKEYIRKRRLSEALGLIKYSQLPLAEIAYTCGYSSQQALCKYVKSSTAMTPLAYQKSEASYYFPRFDSEPVRQVTVTAETIPKTLHMKFYHPRQQGIEQQAVDALHVHLPGYQGRLFGRDGEPQDGLFCYKLAVEYDSGLVNKLIHTIFEEITVVPELSLTFAKTAVRSDDNEIGLAWDYLYLKWLRTSMFEQDDGHYFEEYICKSGEVKKLVLYMPVRKRTDYDKISAAVCEDKAFLVSTREGDGAEEAAAGAVMKVLARHHPEMIRTLREFYVTQHGSSCTCGVRLEQPIELPLDTGLEVLQLAAGRYAVLERVNYSDSGVFIILLEAWIQENGWCREDQPACITYETGGQAESDAIMMKVWIKLKDVKNG
ncbi:AraC family transcriptional regulator [Paenibacillus sp. MMS20-IR301]|uniref:AraC family transcriptional regulator n=1 Tax=Paenibacillus sp. MMS20-IR301 TaxID=2895946 RepID=UPI0028E582A2|nr:AraC family transcriptional regulator [Paenibacillus sp. MMS20-IR301]WNS41481.1 AraC family transcriptional regulator [Paenibacillus sp. MMS20-IR301]